MKRHSRVFALALFLLFASLSIGWAGSNTAPLYPLTPDIPMGQTVATANTAVDGTGTQVTIFTAGANGSRVDWISWNPLGTNIQTVGRVFINNGSTNATAGNNAYLTSVTLPATTISATSANANTLLIANGGLPPSGLVLPAGYKLMVTVGTTVAAGFAVQAGGGDF